MGIPCPAQVENSLTFIADVNFLAERSAALARKRRQLLALEAAHAKSPALRPLPGRIGECSTAEIPQQIVLPLDLPFSCVSRLLFEVAHMPEKTSLG